MSIKNFVKALVSGNGIMEALATSGFTAKDEYGKVVLMQHNIINAHLNGKNVNRKFSKILTFMNFEFGGYIEPDNSEEAFRQVQSLWNPDYIDTLDEEALRTILAVAVPVAVMRNLLARHKVPMNPHKVRGWDQFVKFYSKAILSHPNG